MQPGSRWRAAASEPVVASPAGVERRLADGRGKDPARHHIRCFWLVAARPRRTLATGLQRLGVRLEVSEAVLNHLSGSRAGIVGIYQRHDWAEEKRAALDAWSAHLLAAAEGRLLAVKVSPFSRAGSGEK